MDRWKMWKMSPTGHSHWTMKHETSTASTVIFTMKMAKWMCFFPRLDTIPHLKPHLKSIERAKSIYFCMISKDHVGAYVACGFSKYCLHNLCPSQEHIKQKQTPFPTLDKKSFSPSRQTNRWSIRGILPTQTMHCYKGNPSKSPYICIVWSTQTGFHLMISDQSHLQFAEFIQHRIDCICKPPTIATSSGGNSHGDPVFLPLFWGGEGVFWGGVAYRNRIFYKRTTSGGHSVWELWAKWLGSTCTY